MKFTSQQYAQALYDAVHEANPKDHNLVLDNFVKVLAQAGDLGKYEIIEREFKLLEMKGKGISEAKVTVARDVEMNSALIDQLNKIVRGNVAQAPDLPSKLEIKKQVDAGIVGGVIVRVDDTLIDASIKTQLENLNQSLRN